MQILISIPDEYFAETITKIAAENKLSVAQYASNIVNGWIESQIRGLYMSHVKSSAVSEMKATIGKIDVITKVVVAPTATSSITKEVI
jgi:hypothetical protein